MVIGALVLSVVMPERAGVDSTAAAATEAAAKAVPGDPPPAEELLSPELLKQLEDLLAAAERGDAKAVAQLAGNSTLRDLLNRLAADPELLAKLTRALANQDALKAPAAKDLKALAERSRKAADLDEVSPEMRDMLEKIAEEAELAEAEEAALSDEADPAGGDGPKQGETGPSSAAKGMQELSVQISRQAEAAGGAGIMMMSKPDAQSSGPPGSGVGGSGSQESAAAAASAALGAALSHEIVEASQDRAGDNVDTDIRRKTEQGNSTVAFTHSAAGKFDASRVAPPPAVPEGRRTGVQSYFIRKSP
jgi:hypothetical protein